MNKIPPPRMGLLASSIFPSITNEAVRRSEIIEQLTVIRGWSRDRVIKEFEQWIKELPYSISDAAEIALAAVSSTGLMSWEDGFREEALKLCILRVQEK